MKLTVREARKIALSILRDAEKRRIQYTKVLRKNSSDVKLEVRKSQLADIRRERRRSKTSTRITIETKVPSKWRFHDLETGDVWKWTNGKFTAVCDGLKSVEDRLE